MSHGIAGRLETYFATHPKGVAAVYLFGSIARGKANARSDVDVGVLYQTPPPATLEGLPADLEMDLTRLLAAPVDVVVLNHAPADLIHRVLRDGVLVCDHDRSRRIAFETYARNMYWDMIPVLRRYWRLEKAPGAAGSRQ